MSDVIPDIAAIDLASPPPDDVTAVFAGAAHGAHDVVMTGADARAWYGPALMADDLVFALWPAPDASIVVYAGSDHAGAAERLAAGTLVMVAGGGLHGDVGHVAKRRVPLAPGVVEFFGIDRVVMSSEEPAAAARRIAGGAALGAASLGMIGATVTIRVGAGSEIGQALVGHVRSSFTMLRRARPGPTLISRVAWTRALGSFQVRTVDGWPGLDDLFSGAIGPTATVLGKAAAPGRAQSRVAALLQGGSGECDVVAAADPGGVTTSFTDVALGFSDVGPVVVTGQAVPPRSVVVLRGAAAATARPHLGARPVEVDSPSAPDLVVGPPPAEDRERFLAHQWASAQRRAADALVAFDTEGGDRLGVTPGGPTLAGEAGGIGLVGPPPDVAPAPAGYPGTGADGARVDGATVAAIAHARGWHVIDPELPPVLDAVLAQAQQQIRGGDERVSAAHLAQLRGWGARPGFWARLPSATEPPVEGLADVIVFPYPAPSVDILRAVVASDGDPVELRRLVGPIKVAVLSALHSPDEPSSGGGVTDA